MKTSNTKKIICLMGPTAVGKTDIAIDWVAKYPFDIISVDSALIYRDMNIGTAKPKADILVKAPHRLIDILPPTETYSAAEFCHDASNEIESILAQNRLPLLVGGTMLYYRALQQGLAQLPSADKVIRQQLEEQTNKLGIETLYKRLVEIDSVAAARIGSTDARRIQRALEVYMLTGKPITELQQPVHQTMQYEFINIAILPEDRALLHARIEQRFYAMLEQGFIEEVEQLKKRYLLSADLPSMRAVGYRQIWEYLEGDYGKGEMIARGVAATRQLAKRQLTWLRNWPGLRECPTDPGALF